jgi:hypothetical protein
MNCPYKRLYNARLIDNKIYQHIYNFIDMQPTPKKIIRGLCVFSLSLIAIACSSKTKNLITVRGV